jgi:hypothetical protein
MSKGLTSEQKRNLTEAWSNTLRWRFGGLDFWRLSKKWKNIRYNELASIIVDELDWFLQNVDNPEFATSIKGKDNAED